jgi:hypothetical protein
MEPWAEGTSSDFEKLPSRLFSKTLLEGIWGMSVRLLPAPHVLAADDNSLKVLLPTPTFFEVIAASEMTEMLGVVKPNGIAIVVIAVIEPPDARPLV